MRWEQLFDDLEARFDDLADAEMMAELADRQRVAAGAISMVERVAGAIGRPIRFRTTAGLTVTGNLQKVGPDWVLVHEAPGRETVVALAAHHHDRGLVGGHRAGAEGGGVAIEPASCHARAGSGLRSPWSWPGEWASRPACTPKSPAPLIESERIFSRWHCMHRGNHDARLRCGRWCWCRSAQSCWSVRCRWAEPVG